MLHAYWNYIQRILKHWNKIWLEEQVSKREHCGCSTMIWNYKTKPVGNFHVWFHSHTDNHNCLLAVHCDNDKMINFLSNSLENGDVKNFTVLVQLCSPIYTLSSCKTKPFKFSSMILYILVCTCIKDYTKFASGSSGYWLKSPSTYKFI